MPTGQPRDHCSFAHCVSKYAVGLSARLSSKNVWNSLRIFDWRSLAVSFAYARQLSPPTKPKITPGPSPRLGESSNVALTSPSVETAVPLRPFSRHHGLS